MNKQAQRPKYVYASYSLGFRESDVDFYTIDLLEFPYSHPVSLLDVLAVPYDGLLYLTGYLHGEHLPQTR